MIPLGTPVRMREQPTIQGGAGCPYAGLGDNPPGGWSGVVAGHIDSYNMVEWAPLTEPDVVEGAVVPRIIREYPVLNYYDHHLQVS